MKKLFTLILFFFAIHQAQSSSAEEQAEKYLKQLSLEEKIGQLFMVGFRETKLTQETIAHFKISVSEFHFVFSQHQ